MGRFGFTLFTASAADESFERARGLGRGEKDFAALCEAVR